MTRSWTIGFFLVALASGCSRTPEAHDHDHGHEHGASHEAEEPAPLAITRWTDDYELFVEFPAPIAGKPIPYHAHVTKLDGFEAVKVGKFYVNFKSTTGVAAEASSDGVKRPGIFVFEGNAPGAGSYVLEMAYEREGKSDVFDCGAISVTDKPPPPEPEAPGSTITFLKESQWKIPFATAWAQERPIAREIELSATVEPSATEQLTIAAPTAGRFFHDPKHSPAEGLRIAKGDILGTISPTVTGDDFVELQTAVEESRLAKAQAEKEIERITPLVQQGLLPEKRLIELRNERDMHAAKLRLAEGRLGRVTTSNGAGGIGIRSTLEGIIAQVLVRNGEPVEAGAPLIRIGGDQRLWIRARFPAKPPSSFESAAPSGVRLADGRRMDLQQRGARFLSALPIVDPTTRIATWIADAGEKETATDDKAPRLQPGATVVLLVRTGIPRTVVAVPREAVIDINTQPFVFVQVDGEHFEKRAVKLGDIDGAFVEVLQGVAKDERVVTRGGYDIHLAAVMGTVESHRH
jgi:membrane fusion protein, heavy metal efflux system